MAKSMFDKTLPKRCEYCVFGTKSDFSDDVLCKKYGITHFSDSCRKYKYDPLKRKPKSAKPSDNYNPEDFLL